MFSWFKQSQEIFNKVVEDSLKRQHNEPRTLLCEFLQFWHVNPPTPRV